MSDSASKKHILNWQIRKAIQVVIGIAGIALTYFGIVTTDQVDAVTASPLLATFGSFLAAAFTNRGSDSTATGADVRAAQAAVPNLPASEIAEQVFTKIDSYGKHAADIGDQVQSAATSVADYYNQEK